MPREEGGGRRDGADRREARQRQEADQEERQQQRPLCPSTPTFDRCDHQPISATTGARRSDA